jgi:TolB-like protein
MTTLRATLVMALTVGTAVAAPAQQREPEQRQVTIAVVGLNAAAIGGNHDLAALGANLTSMIMSEFGSRRTVALVERQRIEDLLEQHYAGVTGQIDDRVAVEIGRLVGAQYVVHGGVTMVAGTARFDLRLIDSETSQIHRTFKQSGRESDFLGIVESLGNQFLADLRLPARVAEVQAPPRAVVAYSRGLDFERRGERQKAAQMFRTALEIFAEYTDAATALARVR